MGILEELQLFRARKAEWINAHLIDLRDGNVRPPDGRTVKDAITFWVGELKEAVRR